MEASNTKFSRLLLLAFTAAVALSFVGRGSTTSSSSGTQTQNANLNIVMQDASTEDWATIGVKVMSITLMP